MKYFIHLPMKMEPIVSSEASTIRTETPGNYPKRNKLQNFPGLYASESGKKSNEKRLYFFVYSIAHEMQYCCVSHGISLSSQNL